MLSLNHTGLTVSSLNQSIKWYHDTLGFQELSRLEMAGQDLEVLYGLKADVIVKVAFLKLGFAGVLELFEFSPQINTPEIVDFRKIGQTHIAVNVSDVNKMHTKMVSRGVHVLFEPRESRKIKFFYMQDPDKNIIEIIGFKWYQRLGIYLFPALARKF